jgi:Uma2 family endonuclease
MVAAGVMDEDERVELIGGELVPMSPKGNRHEVVKTALLDRWYRVRPEECSLTPETTFRLSDDTYLEPDVVIYPRAIGLKGLTGPIALLVVEIADSSLRYDMGRKAALYASFGVRELWVIDAVKLTARVFQAPSDEGYRQVADFGASQPLVPLVAPNAFALRLDELELA